MMLVAVFAVVAVGGYVVSRSHAASNNVNDETVQYYDINQLRASLGRAPLTPSGCLRDAARTWSQHVAGLPGTPQQKMTNPAIYHHTLAALSALTSGCGATLNTNAENFGVQPVTAAVAGVPNPAQVIFNSMQPPGDTTCCNNDHYNNMLNAAYNYLGVGSYRDDSGYLWITEEFMQCAAPCAAARAYAIAPSSYWTLSSSATVGAGFGAPAKTATGTRGEAISWHLEVDNNGPLPATFAEHIISSHYNSAWTLLSSSQLDVHASLTKVAGTSYVFNDATGNIPTSFKSGDKYCHQIYYSNASGPGTGGALSNQACVTVQ